MKTHDVLVATQMGLHLVIPHKRHILREEREDDLIDVSNPLHIRVSIMRKKESGYGRKRSRIEQFDPKESKSFESMKDVIVKWRLYHSNSLITVPLHLVGQVATGLKTPAPFKIYVRDREESHYR